MWCDGVSVLSCAVQVGPVYLSGEAYLSPTALHEHIL